MTEQSYFWVYTQKNWRQWFEKIDLYTHVHGSNIYNSQNMQAAQWFI